MRLNQHNYFILEYWYGFVGDRQCPNITNSISTHTHTHKDEFIADEIVYENATNQNTTEQNIMIIISHENIFKFQRILHRHNDHQIESQNYFKLNSKV